MQAHCRGCIQPDRCKCCVLKLFSLSGVPIQDGELVSFAEVHGMPSLNAHAPIRVKSCKAHSFELDLDTSAMGEYERGGIVTQVKEAKSLAFKPLAEALAAPGEFLLSDFSKMERPAQLHAGFQALDAFMVRPPALARANLLIRIYHIA